MAYFNSLSNDSGALECLRSNSRLSRSTDWSPWIENRPPNSANSLMNGEPMDSLLKSYAERSDVEYFFLNVAICCSSSVLSSAAM